LIVSGIANSWYMVGTVPALIGTEYGHLLLLKVALFAAMLMLATLNQFRLAPGLDRAVRQRRPPAALPALRALQRSATLEAALGFLVIGLVSALGAVPPGTHSRPWWPLPWRLSLEAMALPSVSGEIWLATAAVAAGCALAVLGLRRR